MAAARKLTVYKELEAQLVEFESNYLSIIVDCSTPVGMKAAKDSRAEIRDVRSNLEDLRKETKAPVLEKGKQIDEEAKAITERLTTLFIKFDTAIKDVENAKEIAKQKALDSALAKVSELEAREAAIIAKEIELGLREAPRVESTSDTDDSSDDGVATSAPSPTGDALVAKASIVCEPYIKAASERLQVIKKIRQLVEPTDPQPEGSIDEDIARQHDEVLASIWGLVDEYS
jgi:hypothetical protein